MQQRWGEQDRREGCGSQRKRGGGKAGLACRLGLLTWLGADEGGKTGEPCRPVSMYTNKPLPPHQSSGKPGQLLLQLARPCCEAWLGSVSEHQHVLPWTMASEWWRSWQKPKHKPSD